MTLLLARHWMGREPTEAEDQIHALSASGETVAAVARAERHNLGNTLTIAGEFKPFQDVDVHAKVAGYIKVIYFDNRHGRLIPGMYAQTQLSLGEKKNTLTIPLEAVARNADDGTVPALTPQNVIEERHLRLGLEDEKRVEVVSGLQEGDRVVIGNRSQFREGQKVQPKVVSGSAAEDGGGR
ncbi:MAG: hypothetical protein DMG53_27875 [Acidobacteria bacterium]|nr:MAG: hypothetical protein DMG53_27875 [Acidobacteriota bacterium]